MNYKVKDLRKKLSKYGMGKNRYYEVRNNRFTPNCIKKTSKNKYSIFMGLY